MADTYIDYDETRIYGDYAIEQIARHVLGRLREFDPAPFNATFRLLTEGQPAPSGPARAMPRCPARAMTSRAPAVTRVHSSGVNARCSQ